MPDALVFAAALPKLLGAKVVLDLHDPMPELMVSIFGLAPESLAVRMLKVVEGRSIAFAHLVIAVNLACKRIFTARTGRPEKIHVVMNAPDENVFTFRSPTPRPEPARSFVMMYHGSILERNGLDLAVAALAAVRRTVPRAELRIYGGATPFLDVVMGNVRTAGLTDCVRYFGSQGLEGIAAAIDECDVGVIPNRRTIFTEINTPTRIFEYLSRGKPVVTGRANGVCDYFSDDALFFFELGDADDLARVLAHVARHPDEALQVVQRGQKVYLAHRWSEERRGFLSRTAELLHPPSERP
jgi:glycosyltransferase involved in cell wall biosynthesis